MARVLRITDVTQVDTLNLLTGTFQFQSGSWASDGAQQGAAFVDGTYGSQIVDTKFARVTESFRLVAEEATDTTLTNAVKEYDRVLENVRLFHTKEMNTTSYWLEANTENETARRSLLYNGGVRVASGVGYGPDFRHYAGAIDLSLVRHPLWEDVTYSTVSVTSASASGGTWSVTSVPGTAPARMYAGMLSSTDTVSECWLGIRPEYDGLTQFQPLWQAEDGTAYSGADTSVVSSAMRTTFATVATMAGRFCVRVVNVIGSSYYHMHGRYKLLASCKVSAASTTVHVEARSGYMTAGATQSFAPSGEDYVENQSYMLHDLGEIQIPPEGAWYGHPTTLARYFGIEIWAERLAGAGYLDIDRFILMPCEHMLYLKLTGTTVPLDVRWYVTETDELKLLAYSGGAPNLAVEVADRDWYLPVGNSKIVFAGQQPTAHITTDTGLLSMNYYPRWRSYRTT